LSPALGRAMGATYKPTLLPDFGAGADIGNRPILLAVLIAALLHALLLFGVGFAMPEPRPASARNMEVMLVTQAAPMALPPDADSVKAQADRAGETLVPLPELDEPQPEPAIDDDERALDDAPQTEPLPAPWLPPVPKPHSEARIDPPPEPEPAPEPELEPEAAPEPQPPPPMC
jgi:outer membrane biosynthesis protein TonB